MNPAADLPALRGQQLAFQVAVLGQAPPAGLLRPGRSGQPAALGVYQHAHGARLASALRDNFEVLALALGDEAFDALAAAYVQAQPSTTASIRWFGHRLADFMAGQLRDGGGLVSHPALVDMARMDWALRAAFDAADAPPLQRDTLASLPADAWPALRLALQPGVQQLALQWAVEPAWQRLRRADADDPDEEPALAAPEPHAHALLVWRQGLDTRWRALDEAEAALLQAVASGQDFAALCALAADPALVDPVQAGTEPAARVVGLLQRWLADGLLRGPCSG